jgi:hypothetical protein
MCDVNGVLTVTDAMIPGEVPLRTLSVHVRSTRCASICFVDSVVRELNVHIV